MAEETGRLLNGAINDGVARGLGIGQAVEIGEHVDLLTLTIDQLGADRTARRRDAAA